MATPWLSVIMPTCNGEPSLRDALDSVAAQNDPSIEIIAVDDGSTDGTLPLLRSYEGRLPLRIVTPGRAGNWVVTTNRGLALARGTYVCFLHQDDLWSADRLRILRRRLEAHPDTAFLVHDSWYIDARGTRLGICHPPLPADRPSLPADLVGGRLLVQNFLSIPSAVFLLEPVRRFGGLDEQLWYAPDWDLWHKLAALGRTLYVPRALASYRIHLLSQTSRRSHDSADFRRQHEVVLDRHLDRRKASPRLESIARFSIEINTALATMAHRRRPDLMRLLLHAARLGPLGAWRYLFYSRILERIAARLRCRLWRRKPSPG